MKAPAGRRRAPNSCAAVCARRLRRWCAMHAAPHAPPPLLTAVPWGPFSPSFPLPRRCRTARDRFFQLLWRPRPPSLLPQEKQVTARRRWVLRFEGRSCCWRRGAGAGAGAAAAAAAGQLAPPPPLLPAHVHQTLVGPVSHTSLLPSFPLWCLPAERDCQEPAQVQQAVRGGGRGAAGAGAGAAPWQGFVWVGGCVGVCVCVWGGGGGGGGGRGLRAAKAGALVAPEAPPPLASLPPPLARILPRAPSCLAFRLPLCRAAGWQRVCAAARVDVCPLPPRPAAAPSCMHARSSHTPPCPPVVAAGGQRVCAGARAPAGRVPRLAGQQAGGRRTPRTACRGDAAGRGGAGAGKQVGGARRGGPFSKERSSADAPASRLPCFVAPPTAPPTALDCLHQPPPTLDALLLLCAGVRGQGGGLFQGAAGRAPQRARPLHRAGGCRTLQRCNGLGAASVAAACFCVCM